MTLRGEPDVPVLVATRDRAALLTDLLRSLTAAMVDWPFADLLVINNGSKDGTWALLLLAALFWFRPRCVETAP
jgi:glycosyltransferase involved in cell wall biosynthesis